RISAAERARRLASFHAPYHAAVDRAVSRAVTVRARRVAIRHAEGKERTRGRRDRGVRILAIHTFTPVLAGVKRNLDIGVLYDRHRGLARTLARALRQHGYRVRYNEPYSGFAGLIYSARRHGSAHGVPYVELEINNSLLRSAPKIARVARAVADSLSRID